MRRTVQEEEEEEATAAFCSSASRCADGGRGPVWFHFKRSGRGTRPVKLMRQVQHGLACVCVCVCGSVQYAWWYTVNISTRMSCVCVWENVLAGLFVFLRLMVLQQQPEERRSVCTTYAGDTEIYWRRVTWLHPACPDTQLKHILSLTDLDALPQRCPTSHLDASMSLLSASRLRSSAQLVVLLTCSSIFHPAAAERRPGPLRAPPHVLSTSRDLNEAPGNQVLLPPALSPSSPAQ